MARIKYLIPVALALFCSTIVGAEEQPPAESFYEQLCRAVIRLEHIEIVRQGQASPQVQIGSGTAFFVRCGNELYVVSARHVVEVNHDMSARVQLQNAQSHDVAMFRLELPHDSWVYHPNNGDSDTHCVDVAAMKIRVRNPYLPKCFRYEPTDPNMKKENQLPSIDAQPPGPILVFGFPRLIGFQLSEQRPMARLGIMSMSAGREFLKGSIGGVRKFHEERCCLIDARMFPGNSGSPVINQPRLGSSKPRLLGLVTATSGSLDFGVIEPVSRIRETLDIAKSKTAAGSWTQTP